MTTSMMTAAAAGAVVVEAETALGSGGGGGAASLSAAAPVDSAFPKLWSNCVGVELARRQSHHYLQYFPPLWESSGCKSAL